MSDLDGATTSPPEGAYPSTPGEFAASWNARTEQERQQWLRARIDASNRALRCFVRDHEGYITALEAQRDSLQLRLQAYEDIILNGDDA